MHQYSHQSTASMVKLFLIMCGMSFVAVVLFVIFVIPWLWGLIKPWILVLTA